MWYELVDAVDLRTHCVTLSDALVPPGGSESSMSHIVKALAVFPAGRVVFASAKAYHAKGTCTLEGVAFLSDFVTRETPKLSGKLDWCSWILLGELAELARRCEDDDVLGDHFVSLTTGLVQDFVKQLVNHSVSGFILLTKPLFDRTISWTEWAKDFGLQRGEGLCD